MIMVVIWYFILWMEFRASPKKTLVQKLLFCWNYMFVYFLANVRSIILFYRIRCLNFHRFSLILRPNWVYGFIVVFWFHRSSKIWSPNVGLEPTTLRLRVSCSTDWASRATYWKWFNYSNLKLSFQVVDSVLYFVKPISFEYDQRWHHQHCITPAPLCAKSPMGRYLILESPFKEKWMNFQDREIVSNNFSLNIWWW